MKNISRKLKNRRNRWLITDKMFLSLFMTGTIIEFSQVGAGFIDGLAISRFMGPLEMAAEGIASPIFSIMGIISGLLAVGMQVRCSQSIGRGNPKEYSRFVSATVQVGVMVSLVAMTLLLIFAEPFSVMLGASGNAADLVEPVSRYLIGIGIGMPAFILVAILAPALQLDSGNKIIQIGAIIEAVSNVVMDFIAVKLRYGIMGIGLASSIACYINLLYLCTYFLKKDRSLHLVKPDIPIREFIHMMTNGSERAIKRLANSIRPIILNMIIISYGGAIAMSALSVRNNFSNFVEIFGAGVASAVSIIVGVYFGEVNEEGIEEVCSFGQKMIMIFSGAVCVLVLIFARPIARLYVTRNGETLELIVFTMRMLALQNPLQALVATRIKYLQAIHKRRNMKMLIFGAQLVFVLTSAFVLGKLFGVYGILACYTVSDLVTLLAVYVYYAIKGRHLIVTKKEYMNLPNEFHLNPGDVISLDICDIYDVTLCSEQITLFGNGHKISPRISYFAALSFEEFGANIVNNGFPNCKFSKPMIDVRAVIAEDALIMRMRDNCPRFDVTKQIAEANSGCSDIMHNAGIRIASEIASEIIYLHTFDTNSLIVRFNLNKA